MGGRKILCFWKNMGILQKFENGMKTFFRKVGEVLRYLGNIYDHIDTDDAAARIRSGIYFRGPNVYILAFSIIIASAGLNVNSTAVIIGAMLISPLMGPIIGMGLAIGTNDLGLLKEAFKNLLVMIVISIAVSTLFFLLSPLTLTNPTELEARTSPTIYDVLIALFGGLAGILENSRKERGTVLSGVAIATALMPPLCTAGYGLAHLDMHYFMGAMYLFTINGVFITLATYLMVKYLRFKTVEAVDVRITRRRRNLMTGLMLAFLIPSIWNVVTLVKDNNFERSCNAFISGNRLMGRTYIYDHEITKGNKRHLLLMLAGQPLDSVSRASLETAAAEYGITPDRLELSEHMIGMTTDEMHSLVNEIYERTDAELDIKNAELDILRSRIEKLTAALDSLGCRVDSLSAEGVNPSPGRKVVP